jgi:hypothetical protein
MYHQTTYTSPYSPHDALNEGNILSLYFLFFSVKRNQVHPGIMHHHSHQLGVSKLNNFIHFQPFWPTGSGCARGFLSSLDACWAIRSWAQGAHPLQVLAERESIYRLLGQTTPENLHRDLQTYTLDPHTRWVSYFLLACDFFNFKPQVENCVESGEYGKIKVGW